MAAAARVTVLPVPRIVAPKADPDPDGSAKHQGTTSIMPVYGQVEPLNRTIKEATVKRYHYAGHGQLRAHLQLFLEACNHVRQLKTLRDLTPHERVRKTWTGQPHGFRVGTARLTPGPNS